MELLQPILSTTRSITFSFRSRNRRNPYKIHHRRPLLFCLPFSSTTRLQVSSHFGKLTSRGNSLRKKLLEDQKVRQNLISLNPFPDTHNHEYAERVGDKLSTFTDSPHAADVLTSVGVSESKHLGESVLLTKLENWARQYERDVETWGIGSNPVFTVFQGSDGKIQRVVVDEDEILSRSRASNGEGENLARLSSKILYAKTLARKMEKGENAIPRNSSLAKFVSSKESSKFTNAIHDGAILQPNFVPKMFKISRVVLFGLIVFWGISKLFTLGNKDVKSRKEEKTIEKVRVEVVQAQSEPPMASFEKPKLDEEELMKSILKAKGLLGKMSLNEDSSPQTTGSVDFDVKIKEFQEMARKVQKIEGKESSLSETVEKENETIEKLSNEIEIVKEHTEECDIADTSQDSVNGDSNFSTVVKKEVLPSDSMEGDFRKVKKTKPRIIRSVKEAREFLANKSKKQEVANKSQINVLQKSSELSSVKGLDSNGSQKLPMDAKVSDAKSKVKSELFPGTKSSSPKDEMIPTKNLIPVSFDEAVSILKEKESVLPLRHDSNKYVEGFEGGHEINGKNEETTYPFKAENWIEKNFHEVEPILKKMGDGFRENYMVAREREKESLDIDTLQLGADDGELEWMEDDKLREIVFQVRDNELRGRDPFHLMPAEDKVTFFRGLEEKVEKENEKLSHLHDFLHSNIENLDYGADGISLYDPPEKIIPRWKGPPLDNVKKQQNAVFTGKTEVSNFSNNDNLQKPTESKGLKNVTLNSANQVLKQVDDRNSKGSKTVIEGSDGTVKAGKKSGKEYWEHTKKWSRGFIESYNSETDPDVKSTMKDIGKDLDRWITEEEIQEAADLMSKLPERNKEFVEKKLNKLKKEMEMFGPQAVVSKYREYAADNEQDYLWWLDLPHVLCIELYTTVNEEQKIGLYSLEMAPDLELEPKPCHVIGFEDAGDCKNFCYIIQAHMEMLENGHAFVVARTPKDTFRDAKANGFGVTVIRKGELALNIDQTLEEVEEEITEIGSKIYHDKITQERSVDISALMKGVFGVGEKTKRRAITEHKHDFSFLQKTIEAEAEESKQKGKVNFTSNT